MFEKIQERFYESLIESIKARKKFLDLTQEDMLRDPKRVSKILNLRRDRNHPYLIGPSEYPYLNYLFLCEDHQAFKNKKVVSRKPQEHIKQCGSNYDKMLWGHINWDKMFQDVITELSELDSSEGFGQLFEDTLVDYAPYANIKYEKLHPKYSKIFIFPEEREKKRQDAIEWVHLRHKSKLFMDTFYEKFGKQTLREFDKGFDEFVSDYLIKRTPDDYSLGLQVYSIHKNISGYAKKWQSYSLVQHGDIGEMSDEDLESEKLLKEYINNSREYMKKLEEYQKKFDAHHIDIK